MHAHSLADRLPLLPGGGLVLLVTGPRTVCPKPAGWWCRQTAG